MRVLTLRDRAVHGPSAAPDDHQHDAAITIRQRGAVLWGGRLQAGETVSIPNAPFVHVFVAKGAADLEGSGRLEKGDAVRLTAAGGPQLTADRQTGAEVLVWEMDKDLPL